MLASLAVFGRGVERNVQATDGPQWKTIERDFDVSSHCFGALFLTATAGSDGATEAAAVGSSFETVFSPDRRQARVNHPSSLWTGSVSAPAGRGSSSAGPAPPPGLQRNILLIVEIILTVVAFRKG